MNLKSTIIYFNRNIKRYAILSAKGNGRIYDKFHGGGHLYNALKLIIFLFESLHLTMEFIIFKNIYLPQIEFLITTRCSLKCKDCYYYVPAIENDYHNTMTFDEYKKYLVNLLKNVKKIQTLVIIGGEPLLNKDAAKIMKFTLEQKKIKDVYLTTNGAIDIPDDLLSVLKQYSGKVSVNISNYTKNAALKNILKTENCITKLKENNTRVNFSQEGGDWFSVSPIKKYERTQEELEKYYLSCLINCVSVVAGKLYVCPRAGIFHLKRIYSPFANEYVDFSKEVQKKDWIDFYSNAYFQSCNYCNIIDDKKHKTVSALQIEN